MRKATSFETRLAKDKLFKGLMAFFSVLLLCPLFMILFHVFSHGFEAFSWDFFTKLPKPVGELHGGVSNAIVGTLMLCLSASIFSVPLGVCIGVFLSETRTGRLSDVTRLCIDTLQGIPSIVMGIIAYTWIVLPLGSFSALSGGAALALLMLPIVAKSTEETLKMIPESIKEAAYALGAPYYKTILKVILPSGASGILSGILMGLARAAGETAPLLFTAFGNPFMSTNIFKPVNSLPLLIFNYATSPYEDWQQLAWGASLLLVLFVLALSLLSKVVTRK